MIAAMRNDLSEILKDLTQRKEVRTYLILMAAGIVLFWLWWACVLGNQEVRAEWVVESGEEMTFLAEDERTVISGIGLCLDSEEEDLTFSGTIHILTSGGAVAWAQQLTEVTIPSYQLREIDGLVEETFELEAGEIYTLYVLDEDMQMTENITWVFYGAAQKGPGLLYVMVCLGALLLLSLLYWQYLGAVPIRAKTFWILLLAGCSVLLIFLSFFILSEDAVDFREAYALSNTILGSWLGNEELAALIPSGVMHISDSADAQSLVHFWTDWNYGNTALEEAEVFAQSASGTDIRSLIPALGITLMRLIQAPYQWYFIAPGLLNALLYITLAAAAFFLCQQMRPFMAILSLLPSVLVMMNSCSRTIWNLGFGLILVSLCVRMMQSDALRYRDLIGAAAAVIAVSAGQPVYLTFALLLPAVGLRRTDRLERWILAGSAMAAFVIGAAIYVNLCGGPDALWPIGQTVTIEGSEEPISTMEWVIDHLWWSLMIFINTLLTEGGELILKVFLGDGIRQTIPALVSLLLIAAFVAVAVMAQQERKGARDIIPVRERPEERNPAFYIPVLGIPILMLMTLCNNLSAVDLWMGEMVIPGLRGQDFLPFLLIVPFLVSHWRRADQYVRDLQYLLAALSIACIPLSLGGILAGA